MNLPAYGLQRYNIISKKHILSSSHAFCSDLPPHFPPIKKRQILTPSGMCAIFGQDGVYPGRRWRTSLPGIEPKPFKDIISQQKRKKQRFCLQFKIKPLPLHHDSERNEGF